MVFVFSSLRFAVICLAFPFRLSLVYAARERESGEEWPSAGERKRGRDCANCCWWKQQVTDGRRECALKGRQNELAFKISEYWLAINVASNGPESTITVHFVRASESKCEKQATSRGVFESAREQARERTAYAHTHSYFGCSPNGLRSET